MGKLNYYDKDDEDIKDEIKDILKQNTTSQPKYDQLLKFVKNAPVDEKIYVKLITIFKESIFGRVKYRDKLEPRFKKEIFLILMGYHIATLKQKKLNYSDYLDHYRKASTAYSRLTMQEVDTQVINLVNGKIGAEINAKLANQTSAQKITDAKLQAISKGLPDMKAGTVDTKKPQVGDIVQKKIADSAKDSKEKILDNLSILIQGRPSEVKRDREKLKLLGIEDGELDKLTNSIYKVIEQNSLITQIADIRSTLKEHAERIERVEEALQELTKSKEEDFLEIMIGIGFTVAFEGIVIGAIGKIASNLLKKNVKAFSGYWFKSTASGMKDTFKKDFWTTSMGQVLDEALKDGLKQGLRSRLKYDKVKKYFEEDSKTVLSTFKSAQYPVLAISGFQLEQYSLLLIVLANLGFLTKKEITISLLYFENRFKILALAENKFIYIGILIKEAIFIRVVDTINTLFFLHDYSWAYEDSEEGANLLTEIEKPLDRFHYNFDKQPFGVPLFHLLSPYNKNLETILSGEEERGKKNSRVIYITAEVKLYNVANMDYGVFVVVTDYYKKEESYEFGIDQTKYFIAFASHFYGKNFIASFSKIETVSSFLFLDTAIKLYEEHRQERLLLERIYST